jgi:malonyl-CoA decarboxylase
VYYLWPNLDDVARFHLRNGAILHRLNWMGNPSQAGVDSSSTMLVNYLYDLSQVEKNAQSFGQSSWVAPIGPEVQEVLQVS